MLAADSFFFIFLWSMDQESNNPEGHKHELREYMEMITNEVNQLCVGLRNIYIKIYICSKNLVHLLL